jgi:serine/threonine protein kinase
MFEKCIRLNHPNVVKVFGAAHLRTPIVAVFENASSTNLREYLAYEENQHEVWQKLHEVSLGLKYLFELGITIESLRCDDIWVGTNGIAKVNALCCLTPAENSAARAQNVRWQAPEVVRGSSSSVESIIFSLGICVVEALTGKIPWGAVSNDMVSATVVRNHRPEIPEQATSAQTDLLQRMWLEDPSKRPTISSVVRHFKQFADEQSSKRNPHGKPNAGKTQPYDIQRFKFSGLESTIPDYLDKLKWKCKDYSESKEAVQHIFRRSCDVYELLQTRHRLPNDVVVTSYCEVLVSLNRFFRKATREEPVLRRAKSQKVALQSNVFHRKLDDLLKLLAPATVDPVHAWTQQPTTPVADIEMGSSEEEYNTSHHSQRDSNALAATTTKQEAVRIELFESERPNMRFKAISAPTTPDHAPSLPSRRIDVHDLKYKSEDLIGVGAFGEVYKAVWLGTPVVIKFMGYEADEDAYHDKLFFHELRVWEPLNHPHVAKLYGACEVGKRFFACEFMGNGTLAEYVKREGNEMKTWNLLYQVALGLQYLHDLNLLHNDLKCDNVLIGTDGDAKITDFGLSSILNIAEVQVDLKKQGARQWKSPEYMRGDRLTLASDIYSFGMLILEATTGESPWGSTDDAGVRFQVVRKGNLPLQPDCVSYLQWNLIQMMCAADPSRRVKIAFVVDKLHEFWQHQQLDFNSKELPRPSTVP